MKFEHRQVLWLLVVLMPPLIWFLRWAWRKRQSLMAQFVQTRLLSRLLVGVSPTRQKFRLVLVAVAVASAIIAWARPQWGYGWEEAKQRGLDIIVAIDTSRSMLTEDVSPNRISRAKLAALDLLRLAKNDRLGLVVFAGSAFLQCPLTLDEEAFRQNVAAIDVGIIPQGGTALAEAIRTSLKAYKDEEDNHKVLILITDGEDHEEGVIEAAKEAAKQDMRIFTIGIGSSNGEFIRVPGQPGQNNLLRDSDGNIVKSRLDEAMLQEIAGVANGFYLNMRGIDTIEMLYDKGLAPLPKTEITAKLVRRYHERFYIPLLIAIACLLLEMYLPERPRGAARQSATETPAASSAAVTIILLGLLTTSLQASPAKAMRDYQTGNYENAQKEYEKLIERKPDDGRLHFNSGDAAYKAGRFESAARSFNQALTSPDLVLQERAFYNLGNTWYQLGAGSEDPDEKMDAWEQAVKQYDGALKLDALDKDAEHNRALVKKKLEELKKQQEQQQSQEGKQNDDQQQQQKKQDKGKKGKQKGKKDGKGEGSDSGNEQQKSDKKGREKKDEKKDGGDKDKEKKDKGKNDKGEEKEEGKGERPDQDESETQSSVVMGQMTMQQAKQLLDAQKGEERALIFKPADSGKPQNRTFKDW